MLSIIASYVGLVLFVMAVVFMAFACLVPLFWKKDPTCDECGRRLKDDEIVWGLCTGCDMAENYDGPEDF